MMDAYTRTLSSNYIWHMKIKMSLSLKMLRMKCQHLGHSSTSHHCQINDKLAGDVLQETRPINLGLKKEKESIYGIVRPK